MATRKNRFALQGLVLAAAAVASGAMAPQAHAVNWCPSGSRFCNGFEGSDASQWSVIGVAGLDLGAGLALDGVNNGWVRASGGWNALRLPINMSFGVGDWVCRADVWVRTSYGVSGGWFSVIDRTTSAIVDETSFNALSIYNYTKLTTWFYPGNHTSVDLRIGFWGNGTDQWIQVDDFAVSYCQAAPF